MATVSHRALALGVIALAVGGVACGGATRKAASPQPVTTTAAIQGPRIEKLVVAERGTVSMAAREGCLASVRTAQTQIGDADELRVRCPKQERMKAWFDATERTLGAVPLEQVAEEAEGDDSEPALPAAKVLLASGKVMKVKRTADVERFAGAVHALSAELASAEQPAPGPASPGGWQMFRVTGPAHVMIAGTPARGQFEARVSTSGQYLCEFHATIDGEGPMRATKSGWITAATAARAVDEVLGPFKATSPNEGSKPIYAAATASGTESRSNIASTIAVFERFAIMQDALGDACLPELEAPAPAAIGL